MEAPLIVRKQRLLYIRQAVEQAGRTTAQYIFNCVCSLTTNGAQNKNLKRYIYRDLKKLVDAGEIGVDYFLPNGKLLKPGEESAYTYFRCEYFSLVERNFIVEKKS